MNAIAARGVGCTPVDASGKDLPTLLNQAWHMLEQGVRDGTVPAHTPALASVDELGQAQVRTVVLRKCLRDERVLRFHTDARSPKVGDLDANPHASVLVYDPVAKMQLRLWCFVTLHANDDIAHQSWTEMRDMSRLCYQSLVGSGSEIPHPGEVPHSAERTNGGADHFMVISAEVTGMEVMLLSASGHRRGVFVWQQGEWRGTWVAP